MSSADVLPRPTIDIIIFESDIVAQMVIRNIPDETLLALRARAVLRDGRPSVEAEARDILIAAGKASIGLATQLGEIAAVLHAKRGLEFDAREVDELFQRSADMGRPTLE